jgi:very-short-patch-repair endonuclease
VSMRGHGEGTVWQRKSDKRWVAQISLHDGRRRSKVAKTRTEAFAKLRELQAAKALGTVMAPPPTIALPPSLTGARRATIPGRLGKEYLAAALERGWLVRSVPEARVALVLDRLGLAPTDVAVQVKVDRLRLDFAAVAVKVAIEVDGPHHRLPEIALKDVERDALLSAAGWMVFRVDAYAPDDEIDHRLARIVRFIRGETLSI